VHLFLLSWKMLQQLIDYSDLDADGGGDDGDNDD